MDFFYEKCISCAYCFPESDEYRCRRTPPRSFLREGHYKFIYPLVKSEQLACGSFVKNPIEKELGL